MKKLAMMMSLFLMFALSACRSSLAQPENLAVDGYSLTWNAVPGASGYIVVINEDTFETESNTFPIPSTYIGPTTAKVQAQNQRNTSLFSDIHSFILPYQLATPTHLVLDGRILTWDVVPHATGYRVMVDDAEVVVTDATYTVPDTITGQRTLKVQATRGEEVSAYSAVLNATLWLELDYPSNIRQDEAQIRWDAVPHAIGYLIRIDGVEDFTTELAYPIDVTDTHGISILSVGNEDAYIQNSTFSPIYQSKTRLNTPTQIRIDSGVLRFEGDSRATGYILVIDGGQEIQLTGTSYDQISMLQGEHTVTINAVHEEGAYLDSAFAQATLNFPVVALNGIENILISANTLTFDVVVHAEEYEIFFKGVSYTTTPETTFTIPASWLEDPEAYIEIRALSSLYASGPLSPKVFINVTRITTYAELLQMGETGHYILENDISATSPWTPKAFSGSINGQGFTISNLLIDTAYAHTGFFSTLDEASIQNLTLSGEISIISTIDRPRVGALAGTITRSEIHQVILDVDIDVVSQNGIGFLGGLAGIIENTNVTATHVSGDISAIYMTTGGFIGKAQNSLTSSVITQSSYTGTITVSGSQTTPVGGFIGMFTANQLTMSRCFVEADITGSHTVGGFVGYLGSGAIEDAYVQGSIQSTGNDFVLLGGFIGRTEGYNATIRRVLAITEISSTASGSEVYVGAFVGLTVGGSIADIYQYAHFDNVLAPIDRIGNPATGRGDGITGVDLSGVTSLTGFNPSIWDFSGALPRLAWQS